MVVTCVALMQVTGHPLLWKALCTAKQDAKHAHVQCLITRPALAYLWDHSVLGRSVLPAAALWEMALAAGKVIRRTISYVHGAHGHFQSDPVQLKTPCFD